MVLVDTSVWVAHFRNGNQDLVELLSNGNVVCHPFIVGELACGNLSRRAEILSLLHALPAADQAEHEEVLRFIESNRLMGKGVGYIDAHLLASTVMMGVRLWTLDRKLRNLTLKLGIGA